VAVSKTVEPARIKEAIEAGVSVLGENYVQEARKKIEEIGRSVAWHFIGHLQSNKAKSAIHLFDMIHSVDSLSLAKELNRRAEQENRTVKTLVEVNLSQEATKFGTDEEKLFEIARAMLQLNHLSLEGLMTMPPYFDDPERVALLHEDAGVKEKMVREGIPIKELSMGMSNDFEIAIEEEPLMFGSAPRSLDQEMRSTKSQALNLRWFRASTRTRTVRGRQITNKSQ
jgi:pyridoxal phosphate enzyme (YggS family)